ncbi:MAG: S9 family peptidase [Rhodomicrobium sp.]
MLSRTLIPRRALFGNPTAFGAQISPDGAWLSWLAPFEGVMNVWIAPAHDISAAEPLTLTKGRPINWHRWTRDGRFVLFLNDENGDENYHAFITDPLTKNLRDLTPVAGITARIQCLSHQDPGKIIIGLNDRDARWHDSYLIDLATGQRELLWLNKQDFLWIGFDWNFVPRYARTDVAGGGSKYWRVDSGEVKPWLELAYEDSPGTHPLFFDRGNARLLMVSSVGRNASALLWHDWKSGAETPVAEHPRYDISNVKHDPLTYEVEAACVRGARDEWIYVAPDLQADFALLRQQLPGFEFNIPGETLDDRRWIISAHKAEQPVTYYLLDRDRQTLAELFCSRPDVRPYWLASMQPIETKSRDGLDLLSYLTLPAGISGTRPEKPLPMVLVVHGGPWSRDTYGYRGDHQWLADRGYAVLSVNYRGSTGFGKAFVAAAEKQHAAKMHDDLIDMVDWAIREGIADKDKVAIFGGSYGGYASFVGVTFTPEVFCCSVPVVGITNLQTLLETIPPYWTGFAEFMYRSYGDPRTEEGRALLAERSPIHRVDRISKPMLIFHGANDVRCKIAESDTIVAAMQAKGIPVTYVVFPDEGHGFAKPENRLAYYAIAEAFFARHLGGACEAMGEDLNASSHQIRAGAEILSGLGVVAP